jgi:Polyketide cyclase / dehydrase and lipid transport
MWSFEYSQPTSADVDVVWSLWSDVSNWNRWGPDLEEVALEGEFTAGAHGALRPEGMGSLPFTITRAEPGVGYSDETPIGHAVLRFDHDLIAVGGERQVRQRVTMEGSSANELFEEFADRIIKDIPGSVARFIELAEAETAGPAA